MARLESRVRPGWVTRFAPAPTGRLHLGHALNAIYVWGLARRLCGKVLLRIEDHDRGRSRPEFEEGILDDLDWLGFGPDLGTTAEFRAGASGFRQSNRGERYEAALRRLAERDPAMVYRCRCSRREIAAMSGHTPGVESPYPGTCRTANHPTDSTPATRLLMSPGLETFDDVALGPFSEDPAAQSGDLLVRDRRGYWTYQFAVVVDDIEQGVDVVIRGEDLRSSTARQIRLAKLLGRADPPVFLHHPLIYRADGPKLSKSAGDSGIGELRDAGWSPARVIGEAAFRGGLTPRAMSIEAGEVSALFGTATRHAQRK